jgi:hypothetical protein
MTKTSKIYWAAAGTAVLLICGTAVMTWRVVSRLSGDRAQEEVAAFRRTHPEESRQFTEMRPASLRAAMMLVVENNTDAASVAQSIKRKWGNVSGVSEYADNVILQETEKLDRIHRMVEDFERDTANGGVPFDYVRRDDSTEETGLLVLKDGNILRKTVFVSQLR